MVHILDNIQENTRRINELESVIQDLKERIIALEKNSSVPCFKSNHYSTRQEGVLNLFKELCLKYGCTTEIIQGRRQRADIVDTRKCIAKSLLDYGCTVKEISIVMQRDESSIRNLLKH